MNTCSKIYVGQTTKPIEKRFLQHAKTSSPLGKAMRQCGLDNFTIEVIEICETAEQARQREMFWIKVLKCKTPNGYNRSDGGEGGIHKPRIKLCGVEMKLGEWMKMYRARNNMTMQDLAKACGFSKAYIGALEKGINPSTGKPYSPTIQTFEKIAKGTGQDLDSLLKALDGDQPITLNAPPKSLSDEQENILKAYDELNSEGRRDFWSYLEFLKYKYTPAIVLGANFNTNITVK